MTATLRHILRLTAAAMAAALAAGCDVHEFPSEETPPPVVESRLKLTFDGVDMPLHTTVEFDSDGRRARSAEEGARDSRHIINVYADDSHDEDIASGTRAPSRSVTATAIVTDRADAATDDRTVTISLPPGSYRYVVWSDYVEAGSDADLYYDTSDFSEIALRSAGSPSEAYIHRGNSPWRDAFRGEGSFRVGADGAMYAPDDRDCASPLAEAVITMRRPLARYVFVTTDLSDFISRHGLRPLSDEVDTESSPRPLPTVDLSDFRVVFRYTGYMPSVYNAHIDKPVNSITGVSFDGAITRADDGNTAELGSDYISVNGHETSVQVAVDVYDRNTGTRVASTNPITVPLVRNRLTIVRGRFLTSKAGSSVGISPGFKDDINIEIR